MASADNFFYLTLVRHGQTESNKCQILQGQIDTLLSEDGREQARKLSTYLTSLGVFFDLVFSSDLTRALETAEIIVTDHRPKLEPLSMTCEHIGAVRKVKRLPSSELTDSGNCSGTESDTGLSSSSPSPNNFVSLASLSSGSSACSSLCDRIKVDSRLRERSYGILEGQTTKQLRDAARSAGYDEKSYTSFTPSGGESLEKVRQRITDFCCNHLLDQVISVQKKKVADGERNIEIALDARTCDFGCYGSSPEEKSPEQPVCVLITTHGGVIREFMRYFRDQYKCLLSPLTEPLQVTPNTGVNIFKVHYERNAQDQSHVISKVTLLVYHDITHLKDEHAKANCIHSNDISTLINRFHRRQVEVSKASATPAKPQFEAL